MYRRVLTPEGYPIEQAADVFTRRDDLLIQLDKTLRQILALTGGGSGGGGTPVVFPAKAQKLYTASVPLGVANTEVRWQIPAGTKQFGLHTRNGNAIRIASEPGKVAGSLDPYFTLKANTALECTELDIPGTADMIWYFSCSVANEVVEIIIGV